MTHPQYPHMFTPLQVAHLTLPNRVIMGSMHIGLEEEKNGMAALAQFYKERAEGGAGLIVTGGISPNRRGALGPGGARMANQRHARSHEVITSAVHDAGGRICLQLLHGGRYSYHPFNVAPSAIQAPINRFKPRALSARGIKETIADFAHAARMAQSAGYDGLEIMGSEGYLINQFLVSRTNKRTDEWGGSFEKRMRFPLEIVRSIREACGADFVVMYRLSMLDLVEDGSTWEEVVMLAQAIEAAGADIINTGIGWHEARIPTIATLVPRGGFSFVTAKLKGHVNIPLVTTNRFNMPDTCEAALAAGHADLVSMARPFLADPDIVRKSEANRPDRINTCIGCNQACLDHIFQRKSASCLVNPRAGRETSMPANPAQVTRAKRIIVVGGGPAGMSCAYEAARRGHQVELWEASDRLGGQFNIAQQIPGKSEFAETIRYFSTVLQEHDVKVRLNHRATPESIHDAEAEVIVVATGVRPRPLQLPGAERPEVVSYLEVLTGQVKVGRRVAIVGAGGIGFDTADFLSHDADAELGFYKSWGIDKSLDAQSGLIPPGNRTSQREIHMFQRSKDKMGANLGKTTGWIHRQTLKQRGVTFHTGVSYEMVGEAGLVYKDSEGKQRHLPVDHVVVCAGQTPNNTLHAALKLAGSWELHLIGGAGDARQLDAERAIIEGTQLGRAL
ncbi:FAD-dependent oxidoreductase [bacterium]|nr:FAD-dependent oxidoreductase [bacterium]